MLICTSRTVPSCSRMCDQPCCKRVQKVTGRRREALLPDRCVSAFSGFSRQSEENLPQSNALRVQADLIGANGHAERRAAFHMIHRNAPGLIRHPTLGAQLPTDAPSVRAPLVTATTTLQPGCQIVRERLPDFQRTAIVSWQTIRPQF